MSIILFDNGIACEECDIVCERLYHKDTIEDVLNTHIIKHHPNIHIDVIRSGSRQSS